MTKNNGCYNGVCSTLGEANSQKEPIWEGAGPAKVRDPTGPRLAPETVTGKKNQEPNAAVPVRGRVLHFTQKSITLNMTIDPPGSLAH